MSTKNIISNSSVQTKRIAAKFARQILQQKPGLEAVVLALHGELGSGKTTFLQGFAKGFGIKEKVLSPTFILMKKFQIRNSEFLHFYHIDCYRLKNEEGLIQLGLKEVISNPYNIVAIEWPEKISKILPKSILKIKFSYIAKNQRGLTIDANKINVIE